jgi:hypothetical protein
MANTIRNLYSNTAGNTPSSLGNGVIAVNQADGKLFYRNGSGVVTALATGGGSSLVSYATAASFPATGSSSTLYLASDSSKLYRWESTVYVEVGAVASSGVVTSVAGRTGDVVISYLDVSGIGENDQNILANQIFG